MRTRDPIRWQARRSQAIKIGEQAINILKTEGWCQGSFAATAERTPCSVTNPKAAAYCTLGAIEKSKTRLRDRTGSDQVLINKVCTIINGKSLVDYNDNVYTKKEDIIRLLRKAIRSLTKEAELEATV
jgi:hypothetical protein